MTESRLTDLEMTVAFQEKTIQDLSDVICRQQGEIDSLDGRIKKLAARLETNSSSETDTLAPVDETPPHY